MKKAVKDGWHEYNGMSIYIEDGRVIKGIRDDVTTYPYKHMLRKSTAYPYPMIDDGWKNVSGISYESFKRLWNADKIVMK